MFSSQPCSLDDLTIAVALSIHRVDNRYERQLVDSWLAMSTEQARAFVDHLRANLEDIVADPRHHGFNNTETETLRCCLLSHPPLPPVCALDLDAVLEDIVLSVEATLRRMGCSCGAVHAV